MNRTKKNSYNPKTDKSHLKSEALIQIEINRFIAKCRSIGENKHETVNIKHLSHLYNVLYLWIFPQATLANMIETQN